jgi:hypothetical protein
LRNAAESISPAIVSILILVDVVAKEDDIINRVLWRYDVRLLYFPMRFEKTYFANSIAVGVEETKRVIGARIDGETDLGNVVVRIWSGLGSSNGALVIRVAYSKLVVIRGKWSQIFCFYLSDVST